MKRKKLTVAQIKHRVNEAEFAVLGCAQQLRLALMNLEQVRGTALVPRALVGAEEAQRALCAAVDAWQKVKGVK